MKKLLLFSALAVLVGCHPVSGVGGECQSNEECAPELKCGTNYPGGYCYETCTYTPSVCPIGSACVTLRGGSTSECYEACNQAADCRSGYRCALVSGLRSYKGVCLPA